MFLILFDSGFRCDEQINLEKQAKDQKNNNNPLEFRYEANLLPNHFSSRINSEHHRTVRKKSKKIYIYNACNSNKRKYGC